MNNLKSRAQVCKPCSYRCRLPGMAFQRATKTTAVCDVCGEEKTTVKITLSPSEALNMANRKDN